MTTPAAGSEDQEPEEPTVTEAEDELVDEMVEESFPGSDPPASWAGPDRPPG